MLFLPNILLVWKYCPLTIQYEKNIQIFDDGGWHFNNLYDAETISTKLRNIQNVDKGLKNVYTEIDMIKNKMLNLEDVFHRNHKYEKIRHFF